MTLEEAIMNLKSLAEGNHMKGMTSQILSLKLGIEALKEVKKARYGDPALDGELLPGETEE